MTDYDLFESISQGSLREKTSKNSKLETIAHELERRCRIYAEELRNGKNNVI